MNPLPITGRNAPAKSNAERQRQFRERNPGYYAALKRTSRASAKRGAAILLKEHAARREAAEAAEAGAAAGAIPPTPTPPTIATDRVAA